MDNSKSIKFNFNKRILKTTALVVAGVFCISTAFVDLVWACPSKQRANVFLRIPSAGEDDRLENELLKRIKTGQKLQETASLSTTQSQESPISNPPKAQKLQKHFKENLLNAEVSFLVRLIRSNAFLGEKIINTLGKVKSPHSVRLLVQIFDKVEDIDVRARIVYVLTSMKTDESAIALGELFDKYVSYRRNIFEGLKFIGTPGAIRFLIERLDKAEMYEDEDGCSWRKEYFIFALGTMRSAEAVKGLVELLGKTEDFSLKVEIIYALTHYYIPESFDCLRLQFEKEDFKPLSSLIGKDTLDELFKNPHLLYDYISKVLYEHKKDFKNFSEIVLDTFTAEVIYNAANDNRHADFQIPELIIALFNMGIDSFLNLNLNKDSAKYFLETKPDLLKDVFEKISKVGVNFAPASGYLINNRRIAEIETLASLDVSEELSKPEYKEVIQNISGVSEYNFLEQIELLVKLVKITNSIDGIPESKEAMLEHFKEWQENPSVSTFGKRAIELIDADIMPLPNLLFSDESIGSLLKQIQLIQNGGFDLNNLIHIDLNYYLLQEQIKISPVKREITYKEFLEFIDKVKSGDIKSVYEETILPELQREVRGLTYEAYLLREKLLEIEQRAKELGRPLLVVENLSYGAVASAPITKEENGAKHIVGTDISVISTKVGSTACHNNEVYVREDLFNSDEIEYILKNQPIVAVIDASTSVSAPERTSPHIPDAFKGYRNYFMAVNKALLDKIEAVNFLEDKQFEEKILKDSHFASLTEYLKEKVSRGDSKAQPYSFFFWYPGKKDLYLRVDKQKAVVTPKIEDIKQIQGPGIIFIQSAIEPEIVPAHIQEDFVKGRHHSAYFDDREHFKQFYLDYEPGYGVVLSKQMVNLSRRYFHELVSFLGEERITPAAFAPDILAARREIDIVVLDLDGTIAKTDKPLAKDIIAILESLRKKGKHIIILTEDIEDNLESRIIFLASNRLKQGLSIFSSGGAKGFGFDEKGNRVYYEKYNQEGLIDRKLRQKVLTLLNNHFPGQYHLDQRTNRISPDCRIDLNKISVNRDELTLKIKAIFSQEGISAKVYKVGRSSIKIVLQHKADALRYMLKKKQIDESKVLIVADQVRTNQIDRELLSLFPRAVSINVGRYSGSIHKLNSDIIQRAQEGINGTKKILSELAKENFIQLAELRNINNGEVREAHLRGERESERSLEIVKGKVEAKERIGKMEKEPMHLAKIYPYIKVKFNQKKIDKKHPIVLVVHSNLLFDNPGLGLVIQNLKEQLGENVMVVLPYDKPEKAADFCEDINKLTGGLTNLNADNFVVVPAEAKPEKIVERVKENLKQKGLKLEGMKLKVIGPRNWAEPYKEISGLKEFIMVFCEVGAGQRISRGDIALLAGLVDEELLSKEDKDRLLNETLLERENSGVFIIKLENIEGKVKEIEEIEEFREKMKGYN